MANIQNVDYEGIPSKAKKMRELGQDMNRKLSKIYNDIETMHNHWYGIRYNDLQTSFNNLVPNLNEILKLVVDEIPFALENIANNYAQADKGSPVTSAINVSPTQIQVLPKRNDVGMRFITNEVATIHTSIKRDLEEVVDEMNEIQGVFSQVNWESEAASTYRSKLDSLKTSINNQINEINTKFDSNMTQTEQDIQNAESANTVN